MTTLLESIEGVLKGFDAEDPRAALGRSKQIFPVADGAETGAVELETPLRHPLEDDIIIGEGALVGRDAPQTNIGKQQV